MSLGHNFSKRKKVLISLFNLLVEVYVLTVKPQTVTVSGGAKTLETDGYGLSTGWTTTEHSSALFVFIVALLA